MNYNSSEQTISWFRDYYRSNQLHIKPPYQRKPVWAARQKCSLIESILLNFPIPEIFVQQTTSPEGTTVYAIVDGQQRIRAILQFIGAGMDAEDQEFNKFTLDKFDNFEPLSPWQNMAFADLTPDDKMRFYSYRLSVRYLSGATDAEVRDMFRRLNKFLTPLNAQELRNATYVGPFMRVAERLTEDSYWAENRIVTTIAIKRMADVEFVSELLIGVMHGPQGGSAAVIDEYYRQYEDFDEFPGQAKTEKIFNTVLAVIQQILPDIKETRWSNKTDFYSLFVALAGMIRQNEPQKFNLHRVRKALLDFQELVNRRISDENADVSTTAIQYVRAVEKGANDKRRRADRHVVLSELLAPCFEKTKRRSRKS